MEMKTLNLDFVELEHLEDNNEVCLQPCPCGGAPTTTPTNSSTGIIGVFFPSEAEAPTVTGEDPDSVADVLGELSGVLGSPPAAGGSSAAAAAAAAAAGGGGGGGK